jgi:hypothetical protein
MSKCMAEYRIRRYFCQFRQINTTLTSLVLKFQHANIHYWHLLWAIWSELKALGITLIKNKCLTTLKHFTQANVSLSTTHLQNSQPRRHTEAILILTAVWSTLLKFIPCVFFIRRRQQRMSQKRKCAANNWIRIYRGHTACVYVCFKQVLETRTSSFRGRSLSKLNLQREHDFPSARFVCSSRHAARAQREQREPTLDVAINRGPARQVPWRQSAITTGTS